MDKQQTIQVEVAYARPDTQVIMPLHVANGTTAADAIRQSGVLDKFPEIDLGQAKIGIFSRIVSLDTVLQEKDRVEIYRALIADPKESRRARAEKKHRGKDDTEASV
jgi:putative ubiquitin-RnfH superfamily antitoxin RatB of RatAB toxin-antitoxin module